MHAADPLASEPAGPYRRLFRQAWPVMVGQMAVMANGIVDSIMAGRADARTLAAVAVGNAVYISLYVGLMGIILGLTPLASRHYGAGEHHRIGDLGAQSLYIVALLTCLGTGAMLFPDPILALAQAPPELEADIRAYLAAIAIGLPAALCFRVFHALNQAISAPAVVMRIQLAMLSLKIPLNAWLIWGGFGMPAMGAAGCGWSTAVVMWFACGVSAWLWFRSPRYKTIRAGKRLVRPHGPTLKTLLAMGLPIGGAYLIEVTAFTMVAVLIARFGDAVVAGHQIVANLTASAYMLPLSLANATTVLTAQQLGAGRPDKAREFVLTGLKSAAGCALAVVLLYSLLQDALIGVYTRDAGAAAIALSLMPWILAYHLIDAVQTLCTFALRAYGVSSAPMLIYAVCLWGVGLGGGVVLGIWNDPPLMAQGFWMASVGSLLMAGLLLAGMLWVAMRRPHAKAGGA
jgi:multidrug resistance protein, MATE family